MREEVFRAEIKNLPKAPKYYSRAGGNTMEEVILHAVEKALKKYGERPKGKLKVASYTFMDDGRLYGDAYFDENPHYLITIWGDYKVVKSDKWDELFDVVKVGSLLIKLYREDVVE